MTIQNDNSERPKMMLAGDYRAEYPLSISYFLIKAETWNTVYILPSADRTVQTQEITQTKRTVPYRRRESWTNENNCGDNYTITGKWGKGEERWAK